MNVIQATKTNGVSSLYDETQPRDNCGFGLIAQMDDQASHWLVQTAVGALGRLTHRGAIAADGKSGDGCGLLMKRPEAFLRAVATDSGLQLGARFAVGMVFMNQEADVASTTRARLEAELERVGLAVAGWRPVPTDGSACGAEALRTVPRIEQVFVNATEAVPTDDAFERQLFVARRRAELGLETTDPAFYVASLSTRVISYKGLVMPDGLPVFYSDLQDERLASSLCVFHQRFSTNTWPQWRLAQPFRLLAHNGEINTIQGNRNWANARASKFASSALPDLNELLPLVSRDGSDSASLDNMLEVLLAGGVDLFRSLRLLIPPAWQNASSLDPDIRAFYEYNSMHMEPWDGPAGLVLTEGRYACCALDRNGLRPARWVLTKDRHITLASEIGVYDYDPRDVVMKGRLKPGQIFAADTSTGELVLPEAVDERIKTRQPYRAWMETHAQRLPIAEGEPLCETSWSEHERLPYEKQFLMTFEEKDQILRVLAENGQEATGSMGDDTPLPPLSHRSRALFDYFRQQFAQVTNPPIDPIREAVVMSLETCLGPERNLFEETPEHAQRVRLESPVLSEQQYRQLEMGYGGLSPLRIDLVQERHESLRTALERVASRAEAAARAGHHLVVLSDEAMSPERLPVHALLATGAVHHRLIHTGLRCDVNLIVATATARDPHHFAVLLGYGATAIYPYLAYQSLEGLRAVNELKVPDSAQALARFRKGINKGLMKILSKMGISTVASYRGAQLFEIVGLDPEVVELCFTGTASRVRGTRFEDLAAMQQELARTAWNRRKGIEQGGLLKYVYDQEYHAYNPDVVYALQRCAESGAYADYQSYSAAVHGRPPMVLRDLLVFRSDHEPIPIDDVEPIEAILPRFDTAGMSLGALSPEAHESLAMAMNRLGGRSNSGEGGEDSARFATERVSKIKQVASGRFGVTPHYLTNAEVLQIKIAQGAKPGEGGQLPGHKVNEMIAWLRYSRPGVPLISPPPHHDIYSIEDLAQLIFDLKQVNPDALVSVKLVSGAGVGTIAAGVAKAYADLITIAGYDGGTGASPLTSVKYAGTPWEMGLVETHAALRANDLRDKVRVQTDGGLKTGRDVIKGAILGAESFGFGTAPMIAMGCKYLRICHLNNCATGVATQEKVLRMEHFKPNAADKVVNFFTLVAQETRELMAQLGVRRLADLIGRTDLLEVIEGDTKVHGQLDYSAILSDSGVPADKPQYCQVERNRPFDRGELAERMVADMLPAIEAQSGGTFHYRVRNVNRSIGARVSGEIAKRHGNHGMANAPLTVQLTGTVGQSFGVWNAGGLHLYLEGDANDYVGKGMAGGQLVLYPPRESGFASHGTVIMGNTCLYGATGGQLFAAGLAGERFAVRNSGAVAVAEGIGDHGCEYMTGGVVVVLGQTGTNFGAGMTGGFAFVLDEDGTFPQRYNPELVDIHRLDGEAMAEGPHEYLRGLVTTFAEETGSHWGHTVRRDFDNLAGRFWLIKPKAAHLETLLDSVRRAA